MSEVKNLITIEKEYLPSGQYSVSFREPNFGDYRAARKRYPAPNTAQASRIPYSLEELLFATCLEKIDENVLARNPKDIADHLRPFPIPDRQFLLVTFLEMYFISTDEANSARELADTLLKNPKLSYTIDKDYLPSKSLSWTFSSPNTGTQMEVDRRHQGAHISGCSMEEMLFAYCVSAINGKTIEQPKDIVSIFDEFSIADVQFGALVFVNMFTINDTSTEAAKDLGKLLKEKRGKTPSAKAIKTTSATA